MRWTKAVLFLALFSVPAFAQFGSNATKLRSQSLCNPLGPPTDGQTLAWVAASNCWTPSVLGLKASVSLTGQSAAIGVTPAYTTVAAGDYRLCVTLWLTTAGTSGNAGLFGYATAVGTQSNAMSLPTVNPSLGPGGNGGGCMPFHAAAATTIQYSVSLNSVVGSPIYSLDVTVEQLK